MREPPTNVQHATAAKNRRINAQRIPAIWVLSRFLHNLQRAENQFAENFTASKTDAESRLPSHAICLPATHIKA
jgi:hypothetical protein